MKYSWAFAIAVIFSSTFTLGQSGNYVVTNNDPSEAKNSASIFQLKNKALRLVETLETNGLGGGGGSDYGTPRVVVNEKCLFVGDAGSSDIASFQLPTLKKLGNYVDPSGNSNQDGTLALAARGSFLFAAYGVSANIGVWRIGSDCRLSLLGSYSSSVAVTGMRVTPDGKTLVASYGYPQEFVDSFSVSSNGVLTEKGPFQASGCCPAQVDITKDGKYAVFGSDAGVTQVYIFPINSDGTLGAGTVFGGDGSLGEGFVASGVWLSPNEKFLFVSNNVTKQITSLAFDENPPTLSYIGITTLRNSAELTAIGGLTTSSPDGNGGAIYVAEDDSPAPGLVGLLQVNPDGTTTEAPGSPFSNGTTSVLFSLAAYPARSF